MKFTLGLKKLPFKQLKSQIIYTESQYDISVNNFICENYAIIQAICAERGCEFCFLPKLFEEVGKEDTIFYNAPYAKLKMQPQAIGSDFILDFMVRPENREKVPPSLLYMQPSEYYTTEEKEGSEALYKGIILEAGPNEDFATAFFRILGRVIWNVKEAPWYEGERRAYRRRMAEEYDGNEKQEKLYDQLLNGLDGLVDEDCEADIRFSREATVIADEIYDRIKLLRKQGISLYILEKYIKGKEKLSRLQITADYRIFLPDYNNEEIILMPLPKAVFLLFLRHPEGIVFKYLPDYRQELTEIYSSLRTTSGSKASLKSIEDVTDPTKNSINEKCARIREAFIRKFDEHIAQNYFITGARGESKRITLPRRLVQWLT